MPESARASRSRHIRSRRPHDHATATSSASSSAAHSTCWISCRWSATTSASGRPRRGLRALGRRGGPRVGHQRHQARQPQDQARWSSSSSPSRPVDEPERAVDQRPRRGRGLRARRGRRPARAREHAQVERPRHLPHAQLHGRRRPASARPRAAWKCGMVKRASLPRARRLTDPCLVTHDPSAARHRSSRPSLARRRRADGALRPRRPRSTRRAPSTWSPRSTSQCEREFRAHDRRALPGARGARRGVRAQGDREAPAAALLGVRPDRRHDQLRARPADLLLVARRSRSTASSRSAPSTTRRATSCSPRERGARRLAERRAAARVGGRRRSIDALLVHRLSLQRAGRSGDEICRAVRRVLGAGAGGAAARVGGARPLLRGGRADRRLLGAGAQAVGRRGRRADRRRGRRPGHRPRTAQPFASAPAARRVATAASTQAMLDTIADFQRRFSKPDVAELTLRARDSPRRQLDALTTRRQAWWRSGRFRAESWHRTCSATGGAHGVAWRTDPNGASASCGRVVAAGCAVRVRAGRRRRGRWRPGRPGPDHARQLHVRPVAGASASIAGTFDLLSEESRTEQRRPGHGPVSRWSSTSMTSTASRSAANTWSALGDLLRGRGRPRITTSTPSRASTASCQHERVGDRAGPEASRSSRSAPPSGSSRSARLGGRRPTSAVGSAVVQLELHRDRRLRRFQRQQHLPEHLQGRRRRGRAGLPRRG